jgi:phospholipid/cholesterol/gamma-HCH transport system substrate-binding protein
MPSQRRVKWAKFRVTVVALAALIVMATLVYLLTGGVLFQTRARLYLYIADATGLEKDAPVRVDGVTTGKVSSVELSGSHDPQRVVRVTMSLRPDRLASIPVDSFAQIAPDNLVGDKFVDITSGSAALTLTAGGEMQFKNQPELAKSLDLTQFTAQLRQIDATLTDIEQGRSPFGKFVQGTEFYNDLLRRMRQLHSGFHAAVAPETIAGSLLTSDRFHNRISDVFLQLDQDLARVQSGQGPLGRLLRDSSSYDQFLAGVKDFLRSVTGLRTSPFFQSDEAYAAWNSKLGAWARSVDEVNAGGALNGTSVYENLNGMSRQLGNTLRDFRENPRKYLWMKLF